MARKIPWKVSKKSQNCLISEMRTIQPKIPEIPGGKSNGTDISDENFSQFGDTSQHRKFPEFLIEWKAPTVTNLQLTYTIFT